MIETAMLGEFLLRLVTLTFMLVGLLGLVIPIFPGITIIWISALAYALIQASAGNMNLWHWLIFALISLLMLAGNVADNFIITAKMRETGTPWSSILVAYTAGMISALFLTPFAALILTPLALFGIETSRMKNWRLALVAVKGWLIGFGWTFAAVFGIALLMIFFWLLWVFV